METRGGVNEVGVAETGVHELPDRIRKVRERGTRARYESRERVMRLASRQISFLYFERGTEKYSKDTRVDLVCC